MSNPKVTSYEIKTALMSYFRFVRGWLCATECLNADVMTLSLSTKDIHEVEVKVSKADLWKGEAAKGKHNEASTLKWAANRFSVCVPTYLVEEAKAWVEATNPKYGVMQFDERCGLYHYGKNISVVRKAQKLNDNNKRFVFEAILMRVCSENIGHMHRIVKDYKQRELSKDLQIDKRGK